jgi:hypothetical protein
MDIEEALYRVENEVGMAYLEPEGHSEERDADLGKIKEAMELVKKAVEENKELKMFLGATEKELAHEKEQWDLYFKRG